jgi:hypothetical protein
MNTGEHRWFLDALGVLGVWAVSLGFSPKAQLDINYARLAQIESLPVRRVVTHDIYRYLKTHGDLKSIYELRRIPSLSPEEFEEIKLLIKVTLPEYRREGARYVHSVLRELAAEESPSEAAVEEWQDLVLAPMNVNRATVDDLLLLQNVSIVDAVSVVQHTQRKREIRDARDLRTQVEGLSDYGYRNMRSFVAYRDPADVGFNGDFRVNYDYAEDVAVRDKIATLEQNLGDLAERAKFRDAGFSDNEIDYMERRLIAERDYLAGQENLSALRSRVRGRIGNSLRVGFWADKDFQTPGPVNDFKGFAALYDLPVFKKVFIGDYRVTVGQGLMIDNSQDIGFRMHDRTQGLFNDLTPQSFFTFRGGATEMRVPWLNVLGFYSRAGRDGIMNPDGTINYYAYTDPVLPQNHNNFNESNYGGTARVDFSPSNLLPPGSYVGMNYLACRYDKTFSPDAKWLDMPADGVELKDPNYAQLTRGDRRQFYGLDFRTAANNLSLEGEYARQHEAGQAYLMKARTQYNYLYLTGLYRHYDVNYDNPYNRGFCEQRRFEALPIQYSYRLIDPTLTDMQDFPVPKAEDGFYLETRYQISRQITFTRAYVDIWRNLALGTNNWRFQGEVEYRPVYPLRLRLKQKIQEKHLSKDVAPTTSRTMETSLRALASLSNYDFLTAEVRTGNVLMTPSVAYSSNTTIWGGFLSVDWEHNFTDDFSTEAGIAAWQTNGMSQWIFEDTGIDFLDAQGFKYFVTASDRVADFLLFKLKFKQKLTELAHTGITGPEAGLHYNEPGTGTIGDFTSLQNNYAISMQLDFLW